MWLGAGLEAMQLLLVYIYLHALNAWIPASDAADLVKNCDLMWKQSVWTSVLASQIAARHLNRSF